LSLLSGHLVGDGEHSANNGLLPSRPQILKSVLSQLYSKRLQRPSRSSASAVFLEPRFTRQLAVAFERIRAATPGAPRYDIVHQPELPIVDADGAVVRSTAASTSVTVPASVGAPGDYLGLECKYLDANDRSTDADYVDDGWSASFSGDYSRDHPWAVMVGLDDAGVGQVCSHVDARLRERYGQEAGFKSTCGCGSITFERASTCKLMGSHRILDLHAFFLIAVPTSDAAQRGGVADAVDQVSCA
jgi:hypothetical protein